MSTPAVQEDDPGAIKAPGYHRTTSTGGADPTEDAPASEQPPGLSKPRSCCWKFCLILFCVSAIAVLSAAAAIKFRLWPIGKQQHSPPRASKPSAIDPSRIVVACDFGTVGIAYAIGIAQQGQPTKAAIMDAFRSVYQYAPGSNGADVLVKSANVIAYNRTLVFGIHDKLTPLAYGPQAATAFEAAEADSVALFSNFKMALKGGSPSAHAVVWSVNGKASLPLHELLRDVFTLLGRDIAASSRRILGIDNVDDAQNFQNKFKYFFTVPAIWSESAKDIMRQAIYDAGLIPTRRSDNLEFVLEPESAVTQSLIAMDIEAGKRIIVVDAGGGTIDILSTQVISTNPVLLHVTSPPSGGLWGGVAVNQRFLEFFNELFPEISDRALDERIMHGIVKAFEEGKKKITPDSKSYVTIFVGKAVDDFVKRKNASTTDPAAFLQATLTKSLESNHVSETDVAVGTSGRLKLSHEFIRSRFLDPVCKKTADYVLSLLQAELPLVEAGGASQLIVAAGGFAESKVFLAHLEGAVRAAVAGGHDIGPVVLAPEPSMAVVRGAVAFGMFPDLVGQRMLKFSYGIIFELPVAKWPSGNVPAHCSTFKAQGGREYVQYVETLAKAGEMIKVGNVKPKRLFPNTLDQTLITSQIVRTSHPLTYDGFTCMLRRSEVLPTGALWDPRGVHFSDVVASVTSQVGLEGALTDRAVDLRLSFYRTEIKVSAVDTAGRAAHTEIEYGDVGIGARAQWYEPILSWFLSLGVQGSHREL